jgi:mono/diheme cytochrome c family protein
MDRDGFLTAVAIAAHFSLVPLAMPGSFPQSALAALVLLSPGLATAAEGAPSYNRDVRPILSDNCFLCHGPDAKGRKADLRLDTFEGATADLDGLSAIVPGQPEKSELLARIASHDEEERMPPPKTKKPPLGAAQIDILTRWIAAGAQYEPHWAFIPPTATGSEKSIDAFIRTRLKAEGLAPSPEADPRTLIRRMSLDLTGLLPTPEESEDFARAHATDPEAAVAALADRLLASPHYGERWGRHWLDQARYADSNGYSIDSARTMWPYRDWVIATLNADLPFDRFTIEQLAGDLLPNATTAQRAATAFHRNTLINEEGGTDNEQFRNEIAVDRTNTTGAVWLGLTVGCAQCHTHKFDPITHTDYYRLFAFFNQGTDQNNRGTTLKVREGEFFDTTTDPGAAATLAEAEAELRAVRAEAEARQSRWEVMIKRGAIEEDIRWEPLAYESYLTSANATFKLLPDNSLLTDGKAKGNDDYLVTAKTPLREIAALRLDVLTDPSLPAQGPGTAGNGNFVLTGVEVRVGDEPIEIVSARASHAQPDYPVRAAIDGSNAGGWAINVGQGTPPGVLMNAPHEAHFVFAKPVAVNDRPITVTLRHQRNPDYLVGRFALSVAATAPQIGPLEPALRKTLADAANTSPDKRTKAQQELLRETFRRIDPLQSSLADKVAQLKAISTGGAGVDLMVMEDLPANKQRETFIHLRGDFLNPDKEAGPLVAAAPAFLPALASPSKIPTRLDLARWLVSPENPLTARVTVNRIWMRYFGRGLVETENDFGMQGAAPSHPELLDWLALAFSRDDAWSMKKLHRRIVTSATYRQSAAHRPDLDEKDPGNRLLARQVRLRLDAEIVRDVALCASGLLNPEIGGPGVFPPQPEGVYAFTQNKKDWKTSTGPARYRRALYTTFIRSAPYPLFTTFDSPDFGSTCTRRIRSNTPLQSLTLANDASFVELAQGLAARLLRDVPDGAPARIDRAVRLCYGRPPTSEENKTVLAYQRQQAASYASDPKSAQAVAPFAKSDAPEAASWVMLARALMNTDEFITRE